MNEFIKEQVRNVKEISSFAKETISGYVKIFFWKILFVIGSIFLGGFVIFFSVFSILALFTKPNIDLTKKINTEHLIEIKKGLEEERVLFLNKQEEIMKKIEEKEEEVRVYSNSIETMKAANFITHRIADLWSRTPEPNISANGVVLKKVARGVDGTIMGLEMLLNKESMKVFELKQKAFADFQYHIPDEIDWQTVMTFGIILDKKFGDSFQVDENGKVYLEQTKYYKTVTTEGGVKVQEEIEKEEYQELKEKIENDEDVDVDDVEEKEEKIEPEGGISYGQDMSETLKHSMQYVLDNYFKRLDVETCNVLEVEKDNYLVAIGPTVVPKSKIVMEPQKIMNVYLLPKTLDELLLEFGCNEFEEEQVRANLSLKLGDDENETINNLKTKLNYIVKEIEDEDGNATTYSAVDIYARNEDGTYKLDKDGNKILSDEFKYPFDGRTESKGITNELSTETIKKMLEGLLEEKLTFNPGNPVEDALSFTTAPAFESPVEGVKTWNTMKSRFKKLSKSYHVTKEKNTALKQYIEEKIKAEIEEAENKVKDEDFGKVQPNFTPEDKIVEIKTKLQSFINTEPDRDELIDYVVNTVFASNFYFLTDEDTEKSTEEQEQIINEKLDHIKEELSIEFYQDKYIESITTANGIIIGDQSEEAIQKYLYDNSFCPTIDKYSEFLVFEEGETGNTIIVSNPNDIKNDKEIVKEYSEKAIDDSIAHNFGKVINASLPEGEKKKIEETLNGIFELGDQYINEGNEVAGEIVEVVGETMEAYEHFNQNFREIISDTIENDILVLEEAKKLLFLEELGEILGLSDELWADAEDLMNLSDIYSLEELESLKNLPEELWVEIIGMLEVDFSEINGIDFEMEALKKDLVEIIGIAYELSKQRITKEDFAKEMLYINFVKDYNWGINADSLNFFADVMEEVFKVDIESAYVQAMTKIFSGKYARDNQAEMQKLADKLEKLDTNDKDYNAKYQALYNEFYGNFYEWVEKNSEIFEEDEFIESIKKTIENKYKEKFVLSEEKIKELTCQIYAHCVIIFYKVQTYPQQIFKLIQKQANINKILDNIKDKVGDKFNEVKDKIEKAITGLKDISQDKLKKLNNLADKGKLFILKIRSTNFDFQSEVNRIKNLLKKIQIIKTLRKQGEANTKYVKIIIDNVRKIPVYLEKSVTYIGKSKEFIQSTKECLSLLKNLKLGILTEIKIYNFKELKEDTIKGVSEIWKATKDSIISLLNMEWKISFKVGEVEMKTDFDFSNFGDVAKQNIEADMKALGTFFSDPFDGFGDWFFGEYIGIYDLENKTWTFTSIRYEEDVKTMNGILDGFNNLSKDPANWDNLTKGFEALGASINIILNPESLQMYSDVKTLLEDPLALTEDVIKSTVIYYITKSKGLQKWCTDHGFPIEYFQAAFNIRNTEDAQAFIFCMFADPRVINAVINYVGLEKIGENITGQIFGKIGNYNIMGIGDIVSTIVKLVTGMPKYTSSEMVLNKLAFSVANGNREYDIITEGIYKNLKFHKKGSDNFQVIKYIADKNNIEFKFTSPKELFNGSEILDTMLGIEDMKNSLMIGDIGFSHNPNNHNTYTFGIFSGEYTEDNKPLFYYFSALEPPKDIDNRDIYFNNVSPEERADGKYQSYYQDTKYTLPDDIISQLQEQEQMEFENEQIISDEGLEYYTTEIDEKITAELEAEKERRRKEYQQAHNKGSVGQPSGPPAGVPGYNPPPTPKPEEPKEPDPIPVLDGYNEMTDEECKKFRFDKRKEYVMAAMKEAGVWEEWDKETMSKYNETTKEDLMSDIHKGNFVKETSAFSIFVRFFNKNIIEIKY